MSLKIHSFFSKEVSPYIEDLARLRIEVFREFPYLYEGYMDYERKYVRTFAESPDSILVIAFDGKKVVGASTGLPLIHETPNIIDPFLKEDYTPESIFYFSESVLKKEYRGKGIGKQFFQQREAWARKLGRFDYLSFCGVIREDKHPRKPADYRHLDDFWKNQGFEPTSMIAYIAWKDLDEISESPKPLKFWIKEL